MTWRERFYVGIGEWVRDNYDEDCITIININEQVVSVDSIFTVIAYRDRFGKSRSVDYDGSLTNIIEGAT